MAGLQSEKMQKWGTNPGQLLMEISMRSGRKFLKRKSRGKKCEKVEKDMGRTTVYFQEILLSFLLRFYTRLWIILYALHLKISNYWRQYYSYKCVKSCYTSRYDNLYHYLINRYNDLMSQTILLVWSIELRYCDHLDELVPNSLFLKPPDVAFKF